MLTPLESDSVRPDSVDILRLRVILREHFNSLLRTVLTGIYSPGTYMQRSAVSMNIHNEYMQLLLDRTSNMSLQGVRCFRAFTRCNCLALVMLFLNIYLYWDDEQDKCWELRTDDACTSTVKDQFKIFSRECIWVQQNDRASPNCVLSDPDISLNSTILLALIGCGLMSAVNLLIDSVFDYVLLVPDSEPQSKTRKLYPDPDAVVINIPDNDMVVRRLNDLVIDINTQFDAIKILRSIDSLRLDLAKKMSSLGPLEKVEFAKQWEYHEETIGEMVEFHTFSEKPSRSSRVSPSDEQSVQSIVERHIERTQIQAAILGATIESFPVERKEEALFLFFLHDLIDRETTAGRIFYDSHVVHKLIGSSGYLKSLCILLLVILNLGVLCAAVYLASSHIPNNSSLLDHSWMYGTFLCIFIDIVVVSRWRTIVLDDIFPSSISAEIDDVKQLLSLHENRIIGILDSVKYMQEFSASTYLFVSNIIASSSLDHMNTVKFIVASYKYPYPDRSSIPWREEVSRNGSGSFFKGFRSGNYWYQTCVSLFTNTFPRVVQKCIVDVCLISALLFSLYFSLQFADGIVGPLFLLAATVGTLGFYVYVFLSSNCKVGVDRSTVDDYIEQIRPIEGRQVKEIPGKLLLIYICNFHVLSNLQLIYICKLHWNLPVTTYEHNEAHEVSDASQVIMNIHREAALIVGDSVVAPAVPPDTSELCINADSVENEQYSVEDYSYSYTDEHSGDYDSDSSSSRYSDHTIASGNDSFYSDSLDESRSSKSSSFADLQSEDDFYDRSKEFDGSSSEDNASSDERDSSSSGESYGDDDVSSSSNSRGDNSSNDSLYSDRSRDESKKRSKSSSFSSSNSRDDNSSNDSFYSDSRDESRSSKSSSFADLQSEDDFYDRSKEFDGSSSEDNASSDERDSLT